ncbi:MAG: prolyl oligopeptidase family serine peptidase [Gemmatimonadota bacterium]|nr:prolyl oligopeptidase family serine peptidase [Gemmatimonadota bacterium]
MRTLAIGLATLMVAGLASPSVVPAQEDDPFLWLEEVEGERALGWVVERSEATLDRLSAHAVFDSIRNETLEILESDERIAYPQIEGETIYNFWQDDEHERGIWRRTSWVAYLSGDPDWETVLDIDALAEEEGVPWAFKGASCLAPEYRRCMVRLSRGGADAVEIREFDAEAKAFVEGGFFVPEAKSSVAWRGPDALLVSTDFGDGTVTTSGYPRIAKLWRRGAPLAEAEVLFEGEPDDVGVWVGSTETAEKTYHLVFHRPRFFEGTTHVVGDDGSLTPIDVPLDADPILTGEHLVVRLRSAWEVAGRTHPAGSVIAIDWEAFLDGDRGFDVVVEPGPRSTVESVRRTRDHLLVETLENVRGRLWRYGYEDGAWRGEPIDAPKMGSIGIAATDPRSERFFFTYGSYLQPTTLYQADPRSGVREVRRMPAMFDADGLVVEQREARSRDGTTIPYFLVHPEGMEADGENPTLLYGYGGFQISLTPSYAPIVGTAWLERGGVYAVANIRGGGEFGPDWWKAAQKENRQRAYDDFLAVAEDLIDEGVTSPDRLGIHGGSNGGLLVGVAMTQRPELFDAVVVEVPLFDMRRYDELLAGASWMAEYGDPDVPEEWAYIREYSPYQNLVEGADYPVPFFYTTTRDDRVHPGHARKAAAKMESLGHDVLYYENTEGGHGRAVTPEQRARMYAMMYTYLLDRLAGEGDGSVAARRP